MGFLDTARRLLDTVEHGTPAAHAVELAATDALSPWATSDPLESAAFADLWQLADVDALPMSRRRAMQLSVVAAGRRRIANTLGRFPLRSLNAAGEPTKPASLLVQPETGRPRSTTITWTADALIFRPWVHWHILTRDHAGWPTRVRLVPFEAETIDDRHRLVAIDGQRIDPFDAIRFDSPTGGLLVDGVDTLRRAWTIAQAASKAENNPVPALDLHNEGEDLTKDEVEQLLDSWENARRRRGVGYSSRSLKVNPLGASTEQLLIQGRRALDLELARHLGLPAWSVDVTIDGSSLNYTNRASRNSDLIDAIAPYADAIADRLSLDDVTPHGTIVRFDSDAFVRPLRAERLTMLAEAVAAGILTVDEARAEEGLDPISTSQEPTA